MSISVVLPAYKEADNIPIIAPQLHLVLQKLNVPYEILVINTMNPIDNTPNLCEKHNLTYYARENGNTYGDAIRTGFKKSQYDYTVIMDCDGSHDPNEILNFWDHREEADLIIGSRYVKGGSTDNLAILVFLSWLVNIIFRIVLQFNIKDISNSFRMYKTKQIQNLTLVCSNFDIVEEILIKLSLLYPQNQILEVPIIFQKRQKGSSKRDLIKFVFSYLKTLITLYNLKK